ncbi:hypothetical protein HZB60_08920 [candidate division KSB1 bacterium]|nr:hypothetical protein [candidate division KSB1 bacterium]
MPALAGCDGSELGQVYHEAAAAASIKMTQNRPYLEHPGRLKLAAETDDR